MFTGIIEEIGTVLKIKKEKNLITVVIKAKKTLVSAKIGDSICIDGVCLTIISKTKTSFSFELMRETIQTTALSRLKVGTKVNLERALKAQGRLDGHFVMGHVDDVSKVTAVVTDSNYTEIRFTLSKSLKKYIVAKGSVCINGVSLTVGEVKKDWFSVYLIPHTQKVTNLGNLRKGSIINLEIDVIARYVLQG